METAKFAGGPTIKLYGRPMGAERLIMQRIEYNQQALEGQEQIVGKVELW
jgi:hypothetical protein